MTRADRPLYQVIYDELKKKIENDQFMPGQQLPTEIELAEQYGVSRITSKRAYVELERDGFIYRKRGSGSYVMEQEGIEATNSESLKSTNPIIAMILPYLATNELAYIKGATDYLGSRGYFLSIHNSDWSKEKEKDLLSKLPKTGISGIILYPLSTISNVEVVHAVSSNNFPIVTMDQYFDSLNVSSVVSDNFDGGYMLTSRLIEQGHKRISFVSSVSIEYRSSVRDRYLGYCQALRDNRIPIDHDLVYTDFYQDINEENQAKFYKSLLNRMIALKATAIQAEHDLLAVELLRNALESGIQVPRQLSIVGFDNDDISSHVEVPITTIAQDFYQVGYKAAEVVTSEYQRGINEGKKIKLPVNMIERQSVGACSDDNKDLIIGK